MQEIWKDIPEYEGLYQASYSGKIKRIKGKNCLNDRELKAFASKGEHPRVLLHKNGIPSNHFVHILVAKSFIPNPNNYPIVMHKKEDLPIEELHSVDNLQWGTSKMNNEDKVSKDRQAKGVNHGSCILTERDVLAVKNLRIKTGWGKRKISKKLELPLGAVSHILQGNSWKHII